ncbi:hypothetical protein O181_086157 [Austropuccinia psidii MF-1]|uniref:ribonuclease H n=1 Tax=Austropuccinia psidii MF-1 TaxID=1389203 RepID=A0A9Q3FXD9_9BASI|nr:hypothetical protein [Austropuccinia psidii MF-1]
MKPWRRILSIENIDTTKDKATNKVKQLVQDRKPQDVHIFTDGSDIPNMGKGAAAIIMPTGTTVSRHITKTTPSTNFESELVGLKLAIELYSRREKQEIIGEIHIFCDNQGALRKVANPTIPSTGQHLYLQISSELLSLSQLTTINLTWCPGHNGIEGNKRADTEAKKAASNPLTQRQTLPTSRAKIKQRIIEENKPERFTPEEYKRLRGKCCQKNLTKH